MLRKTDAARYFASAAAVVAAGALVFAAAFDAAFARIAAGVAIFLFGMRFMEDGFTALTGGTLQALLKRFTAGSWRSLLFGVVTTSLTQSSSLISVITISFLSAGLIDLAAGIGIVFGANLGTTTGAWLIAAFGLKVDIATWAMPMLALGVILVMHPSRGMRGAGNVLAGFGFLFLGISFMKDGFDAFRQAFDLAAIDAHGLSADLLFVLLGAAATVVMQSSHATLLLTLTALGSGQIGFEGALAIAIGANLGTTVTAIIGSLNANIDGKRLAVAHFLFNLITGAAVLAAIDATLRAVDALAALLRLSDDPTLKLALFHTLFNGFGVLLLTPAIPRMVSLLIRLLPPPQAPGLKPRFLTPATEAFAETLNQALRLELIRLYDNAVEIMAHGLHLHRRVLFGAEPLNAALEHYRELIAIDQLRKEPAENRDTLELEALRVRFAQDNIAANGRLDALIREGRITPRMGMSLMNDLRYTRSIVWALVGIGRALFGEADATHNVAERILGLSDADISRLARGPS